MITLLVEDDRDLAANIGEFLESPGHRVDYATDGLIARRLCSDNRYDAIILDVGLPGANGVDVCRWLRKEARCSTPVLMLTARDLETDVLAGFEAGADDYLRKPFSLKELAARLGAITRRGRRGSGVLSVSDLELDVDTLTVRRGGLKRTLTPSGLRILELLMRASPAVVSREQLVEFSGARQHRPRMRHCVRTFICCARPWIRQSSRACCTQSTVLATGWRPIQMRAEHSLHSRFFWAIGVIVALLVTSFAVALALFVDVLEEELLARVVRTELQEMPGNADAGSVDHTPHAEGLRRWTVPATDPSGLPPPLRRCPRAFARSHGTTGRMYSPENSSPRDIFMPSWPISRMSSASSSDSCV